MPRTKHTCQRSIVSQHLHSTYQPDDNAPQIVQPDLKVDGHANMFRTPSEPGFKHELFLKDEDSDREESEEPKYNIQPAPTQRAKHPHQIAGTFEHTAKNERSTLTRHLKAFIHTSSKADDVTADQRFPMLWDLRERKLKQLEDRGKRTMRTHPYRVAKNWTTLDDDLWIRKNFSGYINGQATGTSFFTPTATDSREGKAVQRWNYKGDSEDEDDQDDEEPDMPGIKRECLDDNELAVPRTGATATSSRLAELSIPPHLKLLDGKVVSRSFCFRAMLNEANDIAATDGIEGVQRTWKWVDGRMAVWPAFEDEVYSQERRRADSVVDEGGSDVKQQAQEIETAPSIEGMEEAAQEVNKPKRQAGEVVEGEVVKKMKVEE